MNVLSQRNTTRQNQNKNEDQEKNNNIYEITKVDPRKENSHDIIREMKETSKEDDNHLITEMTNKRREKRS